MIDDIQFNKLQKFQIGSWAVWPDKKVESLLQFFKDDINKLHGNVIFVGLNRSGNGEKKKPKTKRTDYDFSNFHSIWRVGDGRLEQYIKPEFADKLMNAYMTDLYEERDGNSKNLKNKNLAEKKKSVNFLFKQIKIFDIDKVTIICFGDMAYKHLLQGLLNIKENKSKLLRIKNVEIEFRNKRMKYNLTIHKVIHYSGKVKDDKFAKVFPEQIKKINSTI